MRHLGLLQWHGIKRANGLIKLLNTFAVLDLDLKIARFVARPDYLMATLPMLLNQFGPIVPFAPIKE